MPKDSGIRQYLDAGTLNLFARQLSEGLEEVLSVAVVDAGGERAWCGPGDDDARHWPDGGFVSNPFAADDNCVELGNGRFAYAFPLRASAGDDLLGHLLLQTAAAGQLNAHDARRVVRPILKCLHKQLDIRIELTAVRRRTERERRDAELLVRLDDLQASRGRDEALDAALRATAAHFGARLAVLWMDAADIRIGVRPKGPITAGTADRIAPIFRRLCAAAGKRRRVLLADAPAALLQVSHGDIGQASLLSTPVLGDRDDVAGVLALVGGRKYGKHDVRLVRVVAAKIVALTRIDTRAPDAPLTRHELLARIDRDLAADAQAERALLLVDIDKLHVINEVHGHFGGDAAIRHVAAQARIAGGDRAIVCDLHGGVVAVYLPACGEAQAISTGDTLRDALRSSPLQHDGRRIDVEASVGIALLPKVVADAASALNTAEVAVRSAKARGGDQSVVFDDLDASVLRRREDLDQVGRLQAALLDNRFELHAQPIAPVADGDNRPRYEILLRMIDEDGRMLSPSRFLSAAERYQMMTSIDRWVVRMATEALSASENQLEVNLASFSINVSTQSMMDEEFPGFVENCIRDSGIAPDMFCFEITETAVMRNPERARQLIDRFRRLGCRLALDDFGTGQCSFAYLKELPVQYIKIDGTFIRDILDNALSQAIVESVANIAGVIGARTVAEFVENDRILERLRQAGIDFAQGYGIGKPRPLAEVLAAFDGPLLATSDFEAASG